MTCPAPPAPLAEPLSPARAPATASPAGPAAAPTPPAAIGPCPLCRGAMRALFEAGDWRRPACGGRWRVDWCDACAYGHVAGEPGAQEVAAFYEVDYYTHAEPAAGGAGQPVRGLARWRRHLAWRLDRGSDFAPAEFGAPPARLLDIGCGAGNNLAALRGAGFDACGVEPDPAARAVAARHGPVHAGTAEDLPAAAGTAFDGALLSHVLEHTRHPAQALRRAHAVLRPGGRLVVEVPNAAALGFWRFGASWPWTDLPRHLHYFTRVSLCRLLAETGFETEAVRYTGFTRQFDPSWIASLHDIHARLGGAGDPSTAAQRDSWGLLLRAAWAGDDQRYDSVRVQARRC